jgi:hypothetical protein
MSDDPEKQNPIAKIGEKIMECLPERYQTEEVASYLGSVIGFWSGYFFGKAVVRLLFPHDEEDEK